MATSRVPTHSHMMHIPATPALMAVSVFCFASIQIDAEYSRYCINEQLTRTVNGYRSLPASGHYHAGQFTGAVPMALASNIAAPPVPPHALGDNMYGGELYGQVRSS